MARDAVISWDFKECPDLGDLQKALKPFGVYAKYAEYDGDSYVLVLSDRPLTQRRANECLSSVE